MFLCGNIKFAYRVKNLETLKYNLYKLFLCCHFLGQALEKAGGKDFRKELDDLSKEHGNLDTAGGKGA